MNYTQMNNNKVQLQGVVISTPQFSHEVFGEGFYEMQISVDRLSEQKDVLSITVSERLIADYDIKPGSYISVIGQFRSYNKLVDGKSKLLLTVFVREITGYRDDRNINNVFLSGYICKPPIYRITPFKREIADLLLAVNRAYNKSDYIPCIAWGRNARFVNGLGVGTRVNVEGRIQSREYQKKVSEIDTITKTAFEISVSKIGVDSNNEELMREVALTHSNEDGYL